MTLTPPEDSPLVLSAPEPVAPVRKEQAAGLVPLQDGVRDEMARRAGEYVGSLAGIDARSPEFAQRIGEITALGSADVRTAAQQSNRMLERAVRSLGSDGGGGAPAPPPRPGRGGGGARGAGPPPRAPPPRPPPP
ncbi:hypothetical protein ACFXAL_29335, partial [Streptomyces amritsarensis]